MIKLDIVEYLPIKIIWFKKEIGSILTLLFLALLVESWEDIAQEGLRAYLQQSVWLFLTFVLFSTLIILLSRRTYRREKNGTNKS